MGTELIGLLGGFISISAALPQIYKCVLTQNTKDLSYVTNAVSYVGSSMGVYYGFSIGHMTIVACNTYAILVNTCLLSTKLYFEVVCTGSYYTQLEIQNKNHGEPVL
jgi:MtN3 and saliva related transmembrane protein